MKSYNEVKCRKGMFEEVLEAICYRASVSGESKMLGVSASMVCKGSKPVARNSWMSSEDAIFRKSMWWR